MSHCFNHSDRPAPWQNSVPDSNKAGFNLNEAGYSSRYLCDECAERVKRDVGNTARLQRVNMEIK
jgi:hypothetical protein